MTRFCIAATLMASLPLSASHCGARLHATDRGRCWGDPGRIKAPRPVPKVESPR